MKKEAPVVAFALLFAAVILATAPQILAGLGYGIFATERTSAYLKENGVPNTRLFKVHERRGPNIRDFITERKIDLVISVPNPAKRVEFNSAYKLRRLAVD